MDTDESNSLIKELTELVEKLQLAVEASGMGIWEYREIDNCVHWDDRMLEIYGIRDGNNDRADDFWEQHIHPDDVSNMVAYADECQRNHRDFKHDYRIIRDDGSIKHIRSLARVVSDAGQPTKLIGVNIDVTEDYEKASLLEQARKLSEHEAYHDALTNLRNRRSFIELKDQAQEFLKTGETFSIVVFDLDRFKSINDTLGHLAGDHVLCKVSKIIKKEADAKTTVFRLGGDEFALFVRTVRHEDDIIQLCKRLIDSINRPIFIEGRECFVSASIGYAIGSNSRDNINDIFSKADAALYTAKRNGKNGFQAHKLKNTTGFPTGLELGRSILHAISADQLECYYQPQCDPSSFEIAGAEALVRWNCPRLGVLAAGDFLPEVRAAGLLEEVDDFVLRSVLEQQNIWTKSGLKYPRISVNVPFKRLSDPFFVKRVRHWLKPHHSIVFEILETEFCDQLDSVIAQNLRALRAMGIGIDMDDFGSGHSSILALQAIKPDRVKIDRKLVAPLTNNSNQLVTLAALCKIAKLEGASVIIEGLENSFQLFRISELECELLQGYALHNPVSTSDFTSLLHSRQSNKQRKCVI